MTARQLRAPRRTCRRVCAMVLLVLAPASMPAQAGGARGAARALCLQDAATAAPVYDATVRIGAGVARLMRTTPSDQCMRVIAGDDELVEVQRMGYAVWRSPWPATRDTLHVALRPVAAMLPASVVRAAATRSPDGNTLAVNDARTLGAATAGALVSLLPYAQPRSARGEVSVSLRGARREQVAITLDGLPLTDPATGVADLADVPLAVLGGATVAPGSDPLGVGPGAVGGVIALHTGDEPVANVRAGAFGAVGVEGAHSIALGGGRVRVGASRQVARNDFAFRNASTTTGVTLDERRVNNDLARHALFVQWRGQRAQLTVLGATADLGLVGPVNVRDADEDRSRTTRLFVRGSLQQGETLVTGGLRAFGLEYRDPLRPSFNSDAEAVAADVDARQLVRGVLLHAGVGGDRLRTSSEVSQDRARAFASASHTRAWRGVDWLGGARIDVVGDNGVLPSFSLSAERRTRVGTVGARAAQAVRVPTLYDLYFSSPQRLIVQALRAERVVFDGELYARWRVRPGRVWQTAVDAAVITRTSRNAIVWFPGNFGWSPANVGTESLRGVELRGAVDRRRAHLSAWGTWHRSELLSGSLRIPTPYVPVQAAGAIARLPLGAVDLGASARWLGPRPYSAGPRDPAFTLPGVSLLDLSASIRRRVRGVSTLFAASLDNATDRAWQSVRGFPSPGRAWSVAVTLSP